MDSKIPQGIQTFGYLFFSFFLMTIMVAFIKWIFTEVEIKISLKKDYIPRDCTMCRDYVHHASAHRDLRRNFNKTNQILSTDPSYKQKENMKKVQEKCKQIAFAQELTERLNQERLANQSTYESVEKRKSRNNPDYFSVNNSIFDDTPYSKNFNLTSKSKKISLTEPNIASVYSRSSKRRTDSSK